MGNTVDNEKKKALDIVMSQIEKQFGKGSIMRLGDRPKNVAFPVIPTGALTLDRALGIGGIPYGRVTEIYGPEASGKTTLTLSIIAQAQKNGGVCAFIDAEHALDPEYARNIGVDVDNLLLSQPDTGEQALEITESLIRSGAVNLIVIDSVAALVPRSEIEGNMGDSVMGMQARLMSQAMRKLTAIINKSHCALVFINQIRMKIGVVYGNPETTTGGKALKFYSSVRIEIRKKESLKKGEDYFGNKVRVKIVKNKLAPPFKQAYFDIIFGKGIDEVGCLVDTALEMGIIIRKGTWYYLGEDRIGQGRDNVVKTITDEEKMLDKIKNMIRDGLSETPVADVIEEAPEKLMEKEEE